MINILRDQLAEMIYNDMMYSFRCIEDRLEARRIQLNALSYSKWFNGAMLILQEIEQEKQKAKIPWWKMPDYRTSDYNKLYDEWDETS